MSVLADQLQPFSLAGAGAIIGDTTLVLKTMLTINGGLVTMADFGTIGYGTVEPGNSTLEEQISFTGITQNSNGTATLTGISSIGFASPFTSTSGFSKTHAGSTTFVISNTSAFTASYANKNNVETILANWSVPDPVGSTDIANKEYVLSVVNGGTVSIDQTIVSGTAGENLTKAQAVYLKNDGKWYRASSAAAGTCLNVQLGICETTALSGVATTVLVSGMDKSQSGLSVGSTYYLQDSAGTIGTSAGTISVDIGEGISASNLLVNPLAATTKVLSSVANVRTSATGSNNQVPIGAASGAPNIDITWLNATTGTTDQSQATQNGTISFGEQNLTTKHFLVAEKFVPARQSVSGVTINKQADTGTFTGTVKIALQADSAGSPSGSDLASYTITNAVWVKIATGNFTVSFGTEYETLTVGSSYWIVMTPSTTDNSNHPNVGLNTAGGYGSGVLKYNNTADGWVTVATSILTFATIDGVDTKIPRTGSDGLLPLLTSRYSFFTSDTTTASVTGTASETTVYSKMIPGGFFTPNSGIRIKMIGAFNSNSSALSSVIKFKYNGNTFSSASTPTGSNTGWAQFQYIFESTTINQNSISSQANIGALVSYPTVVGGGTIAASALVLNTNNIVTSTSAVDFSEPGLFEITFTNSSAGAQSNTYTASIIEKIG